MTSGKAKTTYTVKFAATEADRELLQAVDRILQQQPQGFSDLCKQALRQMVLPEMVLPDASAMPLLATFEQQLMTLQLQIMQLEQRPAANADLEKQVQQLLDRVAQLEQRLESADLATLEVPTIDAEPDSTDEEEDDPLLSRLAPLLEDF